MPYTSIHQNWLELCAEEWVMFDVVIRTQYFSTCSAPFFQTDCMPFDSCTVWKLGIYHPLPLAFKLGLVESRVALGALEGVSFESSAWQWRRQTVGADCWVSEVLLLFDISMNYCVKRHQMLRSAGVQWQYVWKGIMCRVLGIAKWVLSFSLYLWKVAVLVQVKVCIILCPTDEPTWLDSTRAQLGSFIAYIVRLRPGVVAWCLGIAAFGKVAEARRMGAAVRLEWWAEHRYCKSPRDTCLPLLAITMSCFHNCFCMA